MVSAPQIPLAMVSGGETVKVLSIRGKDEVQRFLRNLGFIEGAEVTVISERKRHRQCERHPGRGKQIHGSPCRHRINSIFCEAGNQGRIHMRTLKQVKCGETVSVVKLTGEGALKRRIMDMGITKGTEIYVRKVAPLGDPVEVNVRGYELSIRKSEAENIQVAG